MTISSLVHNTRTRIAVKLDLKSDQSFTYGKTAQQAAVKREDEELKTSNAKTKNVTDTNGCLIIVILMDG